MIFLQKGIKFNTFRKIALFLQNHVNRFYLLKGIEHFFTKVYGNSHFLPPPPLFIVGAPRTGSTLLYQLLVQKYHFAYISNIASFFHSCPTLTTFLAQKIFSDYENTNLSNSYGYISGFKAPSEAGPLMDIWFGDYSARTYGSEKYVNFVRKQVEKLSAIMCAPCLFKSMKLSLYISEVLHIFPEALFIHIRRDPLYTAQSIIMTRRRLYNDDNTWFSYHLPNHEELIKLDPFEQVAFQIKFIEETIKNYKNRYTDLKYIQISYDNLTENVNSNLKDIQYNCQKAGIKLFEKSNREIVINKSERKMLSDSEWQKLKRVISNIF